MNVYKVVSKPWRNLHDWAANGGRFLHARGKGIHPFSFAADSSYGLAHAGIARTDTKFLGTTVAVWRATIYCWGITSAADRWKPPVCFKLTASQPARFVRKTTLYGRELMDDCGVMSAMTATTSGRAKFDFQAETCFLQVSRNGHGNGFPD